MSMIERVAKAMCEADNGPGRVAEWEYYKRMAEASILALKGPTGDMIEAGYEQLDDGESISFAWNAMIDAALEEDAQ